MTNIQNFGAKELYRGILRAASPMVIGDMVFEEKEPVLIFDKIQLSALTETGKIIAAKGGRANLTQVVWEEKKDFMFSLTNGLLNQISLGFLFGAKVINSNEDARLKLSKTEILELDQNGIADLFFSPIEGEKFFCYKYRNREKQEKISFTIDYENKTIDCGSANAYENILVEYYFYYEAEATIYRIDKQRFKGIFSFEGRFRSTDEGVGVNCTNIIYMPKVSVVSNLNLRLGERADPIISTLNLVGISSKNEDGENIVADIIHLESDIDSDI